MAVPASSVVGHQLGAGQATTLGGAVFDGDSATLTTAGKALLKQLVASLGSAKVFTLEGYADYADRGSRARRLSLARAEAVLEELRAVGFTGAAVTAGYGLGHPVVVGGKPANRVDNRRVIIAVVS